MDRECQGKVKRATFRCSPEEVDAIFAGSTLFRVSVIGWDPERHETTCAVEELGRDPRGEGDGEAEGTEARA